LRVNKSNDYDFDGTSLKDLLVSGKQSDLQDRILIVDTQRIEWPRKWKNTSVMQNDWRLVNNEELYDLRTDPGQRNNIIAEQPDVVKQLSEAYETWWQDIQSDLGQGSNIKVGSARENPILLTAHDWHSETMPPWHQRHIRQASAGNGYWLIDVVHAGVYKIRLYRWPPYLEKRMSDGVPAGEQVDGGTPLPEGQVINPIRAELSIQDQVMYSDELISDHYFDFLVILEEGPTRLRSSIFDKNNAERGAYYVEIEHMPTHPL
jgi:hypothetical protein